MARPLVLKVTVNEKGNHVLAEMSSNVKRLNKNTKGLGKVLNRVFASAVMLQALSKFKAGIASAAKEVFEFNKTFKQIEGITGTSGKALDMLKKKTIDISNSTEHAATSIAKAVLSISKMGFTLEESLAVMPHVADLATASMVELDEATRVAVQTMKSFQMEANQMEHITNVIQGTVSKTAINFDEYAQSMKFIAPIAQTLNVSLEETSAMIGKLGDVGIKGSLAGTTLKNMFLNIMKPSADVKKVLKDLGANGKSFNDILRALNEAGIPVSSFLETFNKRAIAGSLALAQMTDKTDLLTKALENDDVTVSEVADKIREAWIPSLERLKNSFVNVFTVMGIILDESDLGLGIEGITEKFIDLQEWIKKNPEVILQFANNIAIATKALARFSSEGFVIVVKNMREILRLFQMLFTIGVVAKLAAIASAIGSVALKFGIATVSAKTFTAAIPLLGQAVAIGWALGEAVGYAAEKYFELAQGANEAASAINKSALENKIAATESLIWVQSNIKAMKKEYSRLVESDPSKKTNFFKYKRMMNLKKDLEDEGKLISKEIKTLAKTYGFSEIFFEEMEKNPQKFLEGFKIQLANLENDKSIRKKINTVFNMGDLLGDGGGGGGGIKEKGKKDSFAYWDAALEVQKQIGGAFGIGVPAQVTQAAFAPQLSTMSMEGGLNLGGAKGIGATNLERPSENPSSSMLLWMGQEDPSLIAAKIGVLNDNLENTLKLTDSIGVSNKKWLATSVEVDLFNTEAAARRVEESEAIKENWLDQAEGFMSASLMAVDMIQMLQDAKFSKLKSHHQEQMKMLDARSRREIDNAQGNAFKQAIIARKMAREKNKLIAEQVKVEKKQKEKQRKWAMIEVAINTAVGITQAIRGMVPPASIVMAAIVGAMGFAQLAVISSQDNFKTGGYTGSGDPSEVAGLVHKKEFVIKDQDVRDLGGAPGVEQMIDDNLDTVTTSRNVNIIIDTFIGTDEFKREFFVELQREGQRWG